MFYVAFHCHYNSMQQSVWASMDGHLLLYAFLPALLLAMRWRSMYTFIGSFSQCLLLACPGVLLGTGLTAICARFVAVELGAILRVWFDHGRNRSCGCCRC